MADDIKIFAVGLQKTGTSTLAISLQTLGFSTLNNNRKLYYAYLKGDTSGLKAYYDRADGYHNWPTPMVYRELYELYGERGRFILTVRKSPQAWLKSLKNHVLRRTPYSNRRHRLIYGYALPHGREAEHIAYYEAHNQAIRDFFREKGAEDQLLEICWENGDGWEKLCTFLGRPVPEVPIPHANRTADRKRYPFRIAINSVLVGLYAWFTKLFGKAPQTAKK